MRLRVGLFILLAAIMLVEAVHVPLSFAQPDERLSAQYESETFNFAITWDPEFWTEHEQHSENGVDSLSLYAEEATYHFLAETAFWGEVAPCLADLSRSFEAQYDLLEIQFGPDAFPTWSDQRSASIEYEVLFAEEPETWRVVELSCEVIMPNESVLKSIKYVPSARLSDLSSESGWPHMALDMAGKVTLNMIGLDGESVPGACMEVTAALEQFALQACDDSEGNPLDGWLAIGNLPPGRVMIKEIEPPSGYDSFGETSVTIAPRQEVMVTIVYWTGPAFPARLPLDTCFPTDGDFARFSDGPAVDGTSVVTFQLLEFSLDFAGTAKIAPAPEGYRNVYANILVRNDMDTDFDFDPNDIVLVDEHTYVHRRANGGVSDGSELTMSVLPPGSTLSGSLIFQVPEAMPRPSALVYRRVPDRLVKIHTFWEHQYHAYVGELPDCA
jgi:hypothetical protein